MDSPGTRSCFKPPIGNLQHNMGEKFSGCWEYKLRTVKQKKANRFDRFLLIKKKKSS